MKLTELRGVIPPIVTPFDENGVLDLQSLANVTHHLIDGGVDGIFCLGSTGECAALTDGERQKIVRTVAEVAAGRVPVLAGITETSTRRAVQLGKLVIEAGAQAVVVAPPFYHRNSQNELIHYFRDLASELPVPVIAYNVPVLTKTALEPATVEILAREGTILALKDSGGDGNILREFLLKTRDIPGFTVLTGLEFQVDTALQMGVHGCVPGVGNVAPREYVELYELARNGEYHKARELQERMIKLFDICYQGSDQISGSASALSGFKSALRWLGIIKTAKMAPPMGSLTAEEEDKVREVLVSLGFLRN
ncbi:MAG: dihydrodipicolinate synthase family protein [Limnochordia bacterium]|jgi:4-hydroxy-tetrahydrodipicolinate synthase